MAKLLARRPTKSLLLTLSILVTGLLVSWALAWTTNQRAVARSAERFQLLSERIAANIEQRLNMAVFGLKSLRGLYASSPNVTRDAFDTFTLSSNLQAEFGWLRGFAFVDRVTRADVPAYEQARRAEGMADFTVHDLAPSQAIELYVVRYIEPATDNPGVAGLNLGSEPRRRAALEHAVVSGETTMTAPIRLVQDTRGGAGVLIFLPLYTDTYALRSAEQRRKHLYGLVATPLIMADLLEGIEAYGDGAVHLDLVDTTPGLTGANQLYQSSGTSAGSHNRVREIKMLGRVLQARMRSTDLFERETSSPLGLIVGLGGSLTTMLLSLTLWQLMRGRRRAEELAARMTDDVKRLALVAQRTSNAVIITDAQRRIQWVNAGFERISGYRAAEVIGRTPKLLQTPETDANTLSCMAEALRRGETFEGELLNRSKDGRDYWIELEIQPLRGSDGSLSGFMAIETDVTARRAAQQRLDAAVRENDAMLHTLDLLAIVSMADAAGRITQVNDAFCSISGYERDELIGQTHNLLNSGVHPPAFWQAMWQQIGAGMPWRGEICNRTKDGRLFWVDTFIAPFIDNDGLIERYVAIRIDITDKKQAQEEARRSAMLLEGAIQSMDDAFTLFDEQDRLVLFNERFRETFTVSRAAIELGATFEEILRAGVTHGQFEGIGPNPDAWIAQRLDTHHQAHSQTLIKLSDGRILRVTERRMANGYTVGYRVDVTELVAASEAARQASKAKSQFLANMSHELRTPMNAVLGMLTLLRKTSLTEQQIDYTGKAETAAKSLLGLLNDILDLSKAEAGKMTLDPQPTSLSDLLDDLRVIVSAYIGTRPVQLLIRPAPDLPHTVRVDALRLKQVLINLCSNAVKFTERGQVEVSVDALDVNRDMAMVRFSVRDEGIGIAPEQQARIFEGFHQAEASITRRFGGTGLGLAISQRLVRLMGGRLELQSALGHGSRFYFTITLPVVALQAPIETAKPAAPAPAEPTPSGPPLADMVLLLAEDNMVNQQIAQELLSSEGATVDVANNGQEALDMVAANPGRYAAVLMDMQMPVMDGLTATRRLREQFDATALPIVAMTANAMDADRQACLDAGMNDHVGKPFNLHHLVATLRQVTGRDPR